MPPGTKHGAPPEHQHNKKKHDGDARPDLLPFALRYAASGWAIFPLHTMRNGRCSCGRLDCTAAAKHPRTENGFHDASADPERVLAWWGGWPDTNIGLATGEASGLWVLDVDGAAGAASLRALEAEHGPLPRTLTSATGRGEHRFFRWPADGAVPSRAGIRPGLDVRGSRGYVILPPSLHASGRRYRWTNRGPIAEAPQWLVALARDGHANEPEAPAQQEKDRADAGLSALRVSDETKRLIRDGAPKGDRSEALFAVLRALVKAGHDDATIRAVLMDPRHGISAKPREKGAAWLDDEIVRARAKPGAPPKQRTRSKAKPRAEEWPEPVIGAALLDEIAATFRRFLSLPEGAAEVMALWAVFAHALDAFDHAPRLLINSPTPESGKTTALSITSRLVPRPMPASNVTAAALFRVIERERPTLLIDEFDTFSETQEALSNILNSGHEREMAFVLRTVGDDHEPHQFSTWAPYVIAKIGAIKPPSLASRCIIVPMQRALPHERLERFRADRMDGTLRLKAARWAKDNFDALRRVDPKMSDDLRGRAADNWRPLFAIAEVAGGEWPAKVRAAARALMPKRDVQTDATQLLADIRAVFDARGAERIASTVLVRELRNISSSGWDQYRDDFGLNERRLSQMLKPFGIHPSVKRINGALSRGYEKADFEDAFARYVPTPPENA